MTEVRIATVKATNARYIVQSLDFRANVARCWGEVVKFSGVTAKHGESKSFKLDAVEVAMVPRTPELMSDLFEQCLDDLERRGAIVHRTRRGNATYRFDIAVRHR